MGVYLFLWYLISVAIGYEYWALTYRPALSLTLLLQGHGIIGASAKLSTVPGETISYWLGWFGFGLMVIMNLYSIRKRAFTNWGKLSSWLNFHIFCGLLGPTMIFFHSGLRVRGLVAIAFWSMVVSFTSGIIGRYLYLQIAGKRHDHEELADKCLKKLEKLLLDTKQEPKPEVVKKVTSAALAFAGGVPHKSAPNPLEAFLGSMIGDIRILLSQPQIPPQWPEKSQTLLANYGVSKRKSQNLVPFERLMSYWHTFHFPFAVFMYIAAIIHIISSLIFTKAA